MRKNLPVTNTEYPIFDDTLIVSRTDTKGKITFVNEDFVKASGFSVQELMDQPHNIVRHPDMPPEAYENLWTTLKADKPWTGAVKNRRKNGDYYWVLASATPYYENGQISGYMSIRSKLPADQRQEAEHVYGLIREKKAQQYKLEAGVIRRRSLADRFAILTGTLKARLTTVVATLVGFMLVIGLVGIMAARSANSELRSVYSDQVLPLSNLFEINNRMQQNILALFGAAADGRAGQIADLVAGNIAAITKAWEQFAATAQTAESKAVGETYLQKRRDYVEQGLKPGLALLAAGKFDELARHVAGNVNPLFAIAKQDADRLVVIQLAQAKAAYERAEHNYTIALAVAIGAVLAGILLSIVLGVVTIGAITRPISKLIGLMEQIAQGKFNNRIIIERDDEIGIALRYLQAMQAKLGFNIAAQKEADARAIVEKRTTEEREAAEKQAAAKREEAARKAAMVKLANEFEAAVGGIIETVSSASTELEAAAGTLTQTADTTQRLSTVVAAAS